MPMSDITLERPTAPLVAPAPAPAIAVTDLPRKLGGVRLDDAASLLGSLLGAFGLVWVGYSNLLGWNGKVGFVLCWWVAFLVLYTAVSALDNPGPIVRDRLVSAVVTSGALVIGAALVWTMGYVISTGYPALEHLNFFTHDMGGIDPNAPLDQGGIAHLIVGTAVEVAIATVISLPLGIATAIYLTEVGGRLAAVVRTVVEAMTALPDILAGLFVYVVVIIVFGFGKTGMSVSLALSVTMIPVIARSSEVTLRVVPGTLREASLALGATTWRTALNVVLPTARAGLTTSLILGIARIAGETAPLIIVSGASNFMNRNPLSGPMNSSPLFIYQTIKAHGNDHSVALTRAYGAALVLLLFVVILFLLARFLGRDKSGRR